MLKSCLFTLFLLAMLFAVPARTQEQVNVEAAKTRAAAALKQAREALGGEAALASVKSLLMQGDYKVVRGERATQGNFKIELLMPDKYMRTTMLNMGMMDLTMVQAVNGPEAWTEMKQAARPMPDSGMSGGGGMGGRGGGGMGGGGMSEGGMGGGGGMGAGGGMGGGGMGGGRGRGGMGGGMPQGGGMPNGRMRGGSPEMEEQMKREARAEFSRMTLGLFLTTPPSETPYQYLYERELDAKDGKVDVIRVSGPDQFTTYLLLDQKTHRPWMLTYRAATLRGGRPSAQADEESEPRMVEYQLFLGDYKQEGPVMFPHRLSKAANGQVVEELKLSKIKLNSDVKPNHFERKK